MSSHNSGDSNDDIESDEVWIDDEGSSEEKEILEQANRYLTERSITCNNVTGVQQALRHGAILSWISGGTDQCGPVSFHDCCLRIVYGIFECGL